MKNNLTYHVEYRFLRKDNTYAFIEDDGLFINDEHNVPRRMLGVMKDFTSRKKSEEILKESEEKYRLLAENTQDLVAILNAAGTILWVSQSSKRLLDYSPEELENKSLTDLLHPSDGQMLTDSSGRLDRRKLIEKGRIEYRIRKKSGEYIWVESVIDLLEKSEVNSKLQFNSRDITARKQAEDESRLLAENLMQINEELEKFAYITSHDLRAPVLNLASLIGLYNKENPADDFNRMVIEKVENSVKSIQSTLNALLELVSLKNVKNEKKELIQFQELLDEIRASIEYQINSSKAVIHYDFKECPQINYPGSHIHSILLNLITNALKYKHPDRTPVLTINTKLVNGLICLSVQDNGIGIDMQKFGDKVFGMYKRFHENIEGKGLGLFIIKSQVEALGGKVNVKSEVGAGSTFEICLKDQK
jgi:PAS domain S-box-containing protein